MAERDPRVVISRRRRALYAIVLAAGTLLVCEGLCRLAFDTFLPHFERSRRFLSGERTPDPNSDRATGQPYLLYIPAPGFTDDFGVQHNSQGYRGRAYPMKREPGVARILCMGGSTTYGWGVESPGETYPARLESILAQELPPGVKGIEVINAGLPYGTTAEILTHYHFKFHFYRPDLVILNPGGNDAVGLVMSFYHPDYSHWRQPLFFPPPLPPVGRLVLRSRLISLFVIGLLVGPYPATIELERPANLPPPAPWYENSPGLLPEWRVPEIPTDEIAFAHNLEAILDEMQRDGVKVLLVPFRPSPANRYPEALRQAMALEERLLNEMATAHAVPVAPFPDTVISAGNWVDDCHLNAAGENEKALHVAPYAMELLWAR